jgi:hypothetical protein
MCLNIQNLDWIRQSIDDLPPCTDFNVVDDELVGAFTLPQVVTQVLALTFLILAHPTRNLLSLFNETRVLFDPNVNIIGLFILRAGVIFTTDNPTTSPRACYLVSVVLTPSNTLNFSVLSFALHVSTTCVYSASHRLPCGQAPLPPVLR